MPALALVGSFDLVSSKGRSVSRGMVHDPLLNPPAGSESVADPASVQVLPKRKTKSESLTIRPEDEVRISLALVDAAKKQTTGSIFSLKIDTGRSGVLGIGVKDMPDNLLAVSMLKRANCNPGAGEAAGIRLGDVIFGINFVPTREGSQTLLQVVNQEAGKGKKTLHLQCWRCHQLCSDKPPGSLFPRADDVIVQAHELYRTKVFSDWERWNFIEILLGNMLEDLKYRAAATTAGKRLGNDGGSSELAAGQILISPLAGRSARSSSVPSVGTSTSTPPSSDSGSTKKIAAQKAERTRQMRVVDLERNILQAKGLRAALCVRIVHTKQLKDTVVYVLRVEDVETGLQWVVHRRYRDFHALNEELADMSHFTRDVEFPQKRLSIRNSSKLVESRIVALEQYVRRVLHLLTLYATMDPMASRSLRRLQTFLGVDKYIDCIHPPLVDDQRHIELMAYRFLNDFSSPACQQCVRFVTNVDLDSMVTSGSEGYRPALSHLRQALNEVEQFVLQQHQQQMIQELGDRKPGLNADQLQTFVRRCVRRQVEAAIFLPLRRSIFRIVYSFVAEQAQNMQRAMALLQHATPQYFMIPPHSLTAKLLPKAIKAFRDVIHAYLPADQGQLLLHAAAAVMELHTECVQLGRENANPSRRQTTTNGRDNTPPHAGTNVRSPSTAEGGRSASPFSTLFSPSSESDLPASSALRTAAASENALPFRGLDVNIECTTIKAGNGGANSDEIQDWQSPQLSHSHRTTAERGANRSWSSEDNIERSRSASSRADPPAETREEFSSADVSRRMSTPNLGVHTASNYTIKPQSRLSFSGRDRGGIALGPTMTIDLVGAATFADPVREMFSSVETVPSSVVRKCPDRTSLNLSFLGDLCDNSDEEGGNEGSNAEAAMDEEGGGGSSRAETRAAVNAEAEGPIESRGQDSQLDSSIDMVASSNSLLELSASGFEPTPDPDCAGSPIVSGASGEDLGSGDEHHDADFEATPEGKDCKDGEGEGTDHPPIDIFSMDEAMDTSGFYDSIPQHSIVSADDFLPMFTFVVVQAALPQLLIVKELMTGLVDDEETYGECGYYLATLEASTQHIVDLAEQFSALEEQPAGDL